jgi:two-component system, chemotaxis family, chemotaxis protein CheY
MGTMEFNGKILLVDDEPHIRRFITVTLKNLGHPTFFEANNGIEALALYTQHHPDLVLMDINMPGMDGLETLAKLSAIDPEVLVIMLTFNASRQVVQQCVDSGAVDYIRKDAPKEEIIRIVTEILAQYGAKNEPIAPPPGAPVPPRNLRLRRAARQPPPAS